MIVCKYEYYSHFLVWKRCVSQKNLTRKAVTTMSITNATTQESLVQYPSPYKVVDGNLCMEVTEKHSKYDRKLSNFTPFIKSELTIDDGATETKYLPSIGCLRNGAPNVFWKLAKTLRNMCVTAFSQLPKMQSNNSFTNRQAGRK